MKGLKNEKRPEKAPILLPRARNFSEPPQHEESQHRAKYLSLPPMDGINYSLNSSQFTEEKPLVNLKQVLMIEERLSDTLENLRLGQSDKSTCEDYWSLTEESAVPLLEKLFSEKRTQVILRHACIIELATMAYASVCFNERSSPEMIQHFRNLFYYVHQNFLSIMRLMLHRCSNDSLSNTWTHAVREKLLEKQAKAVGKGGVSGLMKHHTALACKLLELILSISPNVYKPILLNIMQGLYCNSYQSARKLIETILIGMPPISDIPDEMPIEIKVPFLGPSTMPYTLVLDLDETLVHYVDNGPESRLNVRPGCSEFLAEVAKYYEIAIFTAALQDYADWAIDSIDHQKSISHRFYRQHTIPTGSVFIKDLSRFGRDLSKVIIVDNVAENFRYQTGNGLFMKSWFDDMNDTCLKATGHLLREIALSKTSDVRVSLQNYRDQILRQMINGVANPHLNLLTTK